MNEANPQDMPVWVVVLIPFAFFIIFPLMWCFVMWINSHVSGWSRLASRYRTEEEPRGKTWSGVQGRVGLVSYKGVLECTTNESGLFMQPGMLFKFAHPRLFIPWDEMFDVKPTRILWLTMVKARVGDPKVATILLQSKVFEGSDRKALP